MNEQPYFLEPHQCTASCPACGIANSVRIEPAQDGDEPMFRKASFVRMRMHVCEACGYRQEHLALPENIEQLLAKYAA
jgi:C4-type Zn-finger protein